MIALGIILFIIAVILLVPVGVDGEYISGNLKLSARISFFRLQIVPSKAKNAKKGHKTPNSPKETKTETASEPKKQKSKLSFSFNKDEIFALIKAAISSVGNFGGKIKVDRFLLHYTAAGKDPYNTAQTFGYVNAVLSALAPVCAKRYKVKDCDVWTRVDLIEEKMSLDFALALSIRVGQVFAVAFALLYRAIIILLKNKLRLRKERKQLIKTVNTEEGLN